MSSSQKEKKRKSIRKAATPLFAKKGYETTTTRDIARSAKISNAALYYYFDSKEEILYQILEETMQDGLDRITEIENKTLSPKEKLTAILKMHTASAIDFNRMKLLVHHQKSLTPKHQKALEVKYPPPKGVALGNPPIGGTCPAP